jgi:hypothetical protein
MILWEYFSVLTLGRIGIEWNTSISGCADDDNTLG